MTCRSESRHQSCLKLQHASVRAEESAPLLREVLQTKCLIIGRKFAAANRVKSQLRKRARKMGTLAVMIKKSGFKQKPGVLSTGSLINVPISYFCGFDVPELLFLERGFSSALVASL